jgi:uncharacterized protein with HEPN domain
VPSRGVEGYLRDIIENVDAAKAFVKGKTFAAFEKDRLVHYAVLRALEIISEASRHLTSEIKTRHPKIRWRAIAESYRRNLVTEGVRRQRFELAS